MGLAADRRELRGVRAVSIDVWTSVPRTRGHSLELDHQLMHECGDKQIVTDFGFGRDALNRRMDVKRVTPALRRWVQVTLRPKKDTRRQQ